jgi:hypothetical protein
MLWPPATTPAPAPIEFAIGFAVWRPSSAKYLFSDKHGRSSKYQLHSAAITVHAVQRI